MSNLREKAIIPIIVAVLAGWISWKLFSKPDEPYVKYSLTDPRESPFGDSTSKNALYQTIQIINSGKAKSEKIRIQLPAKILKLRIIKANATDSLYQVQGKHFEFMYTELEPDRAFSLDFIADHPIREDSIAIFDSKGKIANVFSEKRKEDPWWLGSIVLPAILWVLYFIILFFWLGYPERRAVRNPEKALSKKLFYTTQKQDEDCRKLAIQRLIQTCKDEEEYFFTSTKCYQILNQDRPSFFQDDEWKNYKESVIYLLTKRIDTWVLVAHQPSDFDKLLGVSQPKHFPEIHWQDIRRSIAKKYLEFIKGELRFSRYEDVMKRYAEVKLPNLDEDSWLEFQEWLIRKIIYEILTDRYFLFDPIGNLERYSLEVIPDERKTPIKEIQQAFYFQKLLLNILRFEDDKQKFITASRESFPILADTQYDFIKRIIEKERKTEEEYEKNISEKIKLKEEESDFDREKRDLRTQETKLFNDKGEIEIRKNEINQKLILIDAAFNVPSRVAVLEADSSPFNEHNTQNLKKLAKFIQSELNSGGEKNA